MMGGLHAEAPRLPAPVGLISGRRMTKFDKRALFLRIAEVLQQHLPQSTRQIFYQCLDPNRIASVDKSDAGYRRVQRAVLDMRRSRLIGWEHVVDGTRSTTHNGTHVSGLADFLDTYRDLYTLNLWASKDRRIELWCESRGFEASMQPVAERYRINTVAFGGQPSDSLLFNLAERLNRHVRAGQQTLVLYAGDLDAAGMTIEEKAREKLEAQWNCVPDWARILVNQDQVAAYNLPTDESGKAVQAEAVPITVAQDLIRDAIKTFISEDELAEIKARERRQYDGLILPARALDSFR